jgi:PAS domain-containing protein
LECPLNIDLNSLFLPMLTRLVEFSSSLVSVPASLSGQGHGSFAMTALVVSAVLLVFASATWAAFERLRSIHLQRAMRVERARIGRAVSFRETLLVTGWDGIAVFEQDMREPVNFGSGRALLQSCLEGTDAPRLANAMDGLIQNGTEFEGVFRHTSGRTVVVLGRAIASRAVVFSRASELREGSVVDWRALLDSLPAPIWTRDEPGKLGFANKAFLAATGSANEAEARAARATLERSELDLFSEAADCGGRARARRFVEIGGQRRTLELQVRYMGGDESVAMAVDVTDDAVAQSRLILENEAHRDVINQLSVGVAVFGADRRIAISNRSFRKHYGLSEDSLAETPFFEELLDKLRAAGRIPEQRDFPAWKRRMVALFDDPRSRNEEVWHLPNGRSERVTSCPHPLGGLTFLVDDLTDELELQSAYNSIQKSQKATLDTIDEAIAVFGPDGRLKLHNSAFMKLWHLTDDDLTSRPHIKQIEKTCEGRIGPDETWSIVVAGVNSAEPGRYDAWSTIKRADDCVIAVSLTRLPDGATMATFSDLTDALRFESSLRRKDRPAA